jgi:hypothetical protein
MELKTAVVNFLWNPNFYQLWYYWFLLAIFFIHACFQFIGFHINLISGLDRRTVGVLYDNMAWFRAILMALMVVSSSLLPALAGMMLVFVVVVSAQPLGRYCAFLAVLRYLGFREPQMQAYIESRTYPL